MAKKRLVPYAGGQDMQPPDQGGDGRKKYWLSPHELAGKDLVGTARAVRDEQQGYQAACERHYRMYRSMGLLGALPNAIIAPVLGKLSSAFGIPASLNVVRPLVNTVTSMVTLNRPKGVWDTEGANRKTREEAKMLERVQDGLMWDLDGYQRTEEWAHSSSLFGTGFVKVFNRSGEPAVEPVFTPEISVDSLEGIYRSPRNMYREMYIDRDVLGELFPKEKDRIRDLATASDGEASWWVPNSGTRSNMIRVYEGTHLRSSPTAKDGCVVLAAGDITLERTEYNYDWHMYLDLRWALVPHMFPGMGIAEELVGVQIEINRLIRQIQAAIRFSNPMVLTDRNSAVSFGSLDGSQGMPQVSYVNSPPSVHVNQTVHPELFTFLNLLYQKASETVGMNQLASQGQAPKRFSSGRAQSINMDIQNSRYAWFLRNYERGVVRLQQQLLRIARETNYRAKVYDRRKLDLLDWKDINFDETKFIRRPWAGSLLGSSPQEKRDAIDWYRANGLVTEREQLLELADTPDLDKFTRRQLAGSRYIEDELQKMLDGGPYRAPPSEINLQKSITVAQEMLLEAYADQVPTENRVKVQKWIRHAQRMEEQRMERKQQLMQMQAAAQEQAALATSGAAAGPPGGIPPTPPDGPAPTMGGPQVPPPVSAEEVGAALQGAM